VIRWIFWDLGDVVFNEEYLRFTFYERLFRFIRKQKSDFLFPDLMLLRKQVIKVKNSVSPIMDIAYAQLTKKELKKFDTEIRYFYKRYFGKYIKIVPRINTVLHILKKEYKLGIIANQPDFILPHLKNFNISQFFDAIYISDIINVRKPDLKIFKLALTEQKIAPEEMIYIGNRIDHDVMPAISLGIKPIQARFNMSVKGFVPSTTNEKQYYEAAEEFSEWPEALENAIDFFPVINSPEEILNLDLNHLKVSHNVNEDEQPVLTDLLRKFLLGG